MKKKDRKEKAAVVSTPIEIPEDEIWTYRIEGLQAPHIGGTHTHSTAKKVVVVVVLLIAISLSVYFSILAIHKDVYQYEQLPDGSYELIKYSNPGEETELTIDCVDGDPQKHVTVLHEYMLNCDEKLETVRIGASVTQIDGRSFYSCWNLRAILVDENNPSYCDVDGVLYTKDLTEVLCCPIAHDQYMRDLNGYKEEVPADDARYAAYAEKVLTYRLPPQTTKVGMLAFNYSKIETLYLPQGLKTIETMSFFHCEQLKTIVTYSGDTQLLSLPDTLMTIGSDAFSYDQSLTYIFIPKSVKSIGHHAFWDAVYKDDGKIAGLTAIDVEADEQSFKANVTVGDKWKPEHEHMMFKKAVEIRYGAEREAMHENA